MRGRILMFLLFAANAHNILWVLGAVEEDKVTKHLNRMEMDQYMDVLELKSMIYKILQANDLIAERLGKSEGTLEFVKTQVQETTNLIKVVPKCERWLKTQILNTTDFFSANGTYFYLNKTKLDWSKTRDWCAERGMQMVMIKTLSQMKALAKTLKELKADGLYWVGASDVGHPAGQFRWVDGTLVDGTTWHNGTMYKRYGDLNERTCVDFDTSDAKLTDDRCSYVGPILCHVPTALTACL